MAAMIQCSTAVPAWSDGLLESCGLELSFELLFARFRAGTAVWLQGVLFLHGIVRAMARLKAVD
eukprot:1111871-Rhodomonas_salina.1